MTPQPGALRLADKLECKTGHIGGPTMHDAATELRRLHALNQELLDALSAIRNSAYVPPALIGLIDAAIAKGEGETK